MVPLIGSGLSCPLLCRPRQAVSALLLWKGRVSGGLDVDCSYVYLPIPNPINPEPDVKPSANMALMESTFSIPRSGAVKPFSRRVTITWNISGAVLVVQLTDESGSGKEAYIPRYTQSK